MRDGMLCFMLLVDLINWCLVGKLRAETPIYIWLIQARLPAIASKLMLQFTLAPYYELHGASCHPYSRVSKHQ